MVLSDCQQDMSSTCIHLYTIHLYIAGDGYLQFQYLQFQSVNLQHLQTVLLLIVCAILKIQNWSDDLHPSKWCTSLMIPWLMFLYPVSIINLQAKPWAFIDSNKQWSLDFSHMLRN